MYAVKRYSIWNKTYGEDLVGPNFSEAFVKMIIRGGRSYDPLLAHSYMSHFGPKEFFDEVINASKMMLKGKIPVLPPRIKRLENFKNMIKKIIPLGETS